MSRVALLSNPSSTGNRSLLPRVRSFCAQHQDIFHYEVESVAQIGAALKTIARINPKVLVINGGDGTVQAALTELHQSGHFGETPPPVAVLPNGKTNLIALDLGAYGDPIVALERVLEIARTDMAPHIVERELIALSGGSTESRPVLGMFLGGAGLADAILFCRNKLYPLGLPNSLSHFLAAMAVIVSLALGIKAAFLPPRPAQMSVSMMRHGQLSGRFSLLMVTTLERLLLKGQVPRHSAGSLQILLIDRSLWALVRGLFATVRGRLGRSAMSGVHFEHGDEIRIEGEQSSLILDGELFHASLGRPIVLRSTPPVTFLKLAA